MREEFDDAVQQAKGRQVLMLGSEQVENRLCLPLQETGRVAFYVSKLYLVIMLILIILILTNAYSFYE